MASEEFGTILVTGASGFLASHIIKQLLDQGHKVRGTVRSLENEAKVEPLKKLSPESKHDLELVEADLTNVESWDSVVEGCDYVIHTAGPFPTQPLEKGIDVETPIVEGTTAVLKACQKAKIKRLVLTSSIVACTGDGLEGEEEEDGSGGPIREERIVTEDDWGDGEKTDAFVRAKIMAEKNAWNFLENLGGEEKKFELCTVLPAYVMGPMIHGKPFTSMELPKRLLEKNMSGVPKLHYNVMDVRDVATAHVKAMETPEAAGNRIILNGHAMSLREIAEILSKEFKPQGYSVPTSNYSKFTVSFLSFFDKNMKSIVPCLGKIVKLESKKMQEILGVTPRPVEETILEMAYSLIDAGLVKKTKNFTGPKSEKNEEETVNADAAKTAAGDDKTTEKKVEAESAEEVNTTSQASGVGVIQEPSLETVKEENGKEEKENKPEIKEEKNTESNVKAADGAAEETKTDEAQKIESEEVKENPQPEAEKNTESNAKSTEGAVEETKTEEPQKEEAEEVKVDQQPEAEQEKEVEVKNDDVKSVEEKDAVEGIETEAKGGADDESKTEVVEEPNAEEPEVKEPKVEEQKAEENGEENKSEEASIQRQEAVDEESEENGKEEETDKMKENMTEQNKDEQLVNGISEEINAQ